MDIIQMRIEDVIPYANNPRINHEAVKYVAESIKEFGFKVPIVIDKNNVIVAGHTRHKAAKKLKLKEVPCIVADDLTEEQIKAFRLADNKVSEFAEWDFDLLAGELDDLFGFEEIVIEEEKEEAERENERLRTDREYNLELFDPMDTEGYYQMPIIHNNYFIPDKIKSFNYALSSAEYISL